MSRLYKILCIGANNSPGAAYREITTAEKNAAAAAKYFETLKKANVSLLTGKDATRTAILDWIKNCNADPEEKIVILFFSGQAGAERNKHSGQWERFLWLDGDTTPYFDPRQLKIPGILNLADNPRHRLILILDACYHLEHLEGTPPFDTIFEEFKKSERFTSLKSYAIISSSAAAAYLFEDPTLGLGIFTYYLLKTLSGKYTFFPGKTIPFFKLLQITGKKVNNHRFTTVTGRKIRLHLPKKNAVITHFSGRNFKFPVLEPTPLFIAPGLGFFRRNAAQMLHFFNCTRLRSKIAIFIGILGVLLPILYLLSNTIVRIHFSPPQLATFQDNLLTGQRFSLDKLEPSRVGKSHYQSADFYLFKPNWVNALLEKLDEKGRIILPGNLLGFRLTPIDVSQKLGFALENIDDVFYWDHEDLLAVLNAIPQAFPTFDTPRKQNALALLAKLGKPGASIANRVFSPREETDQGLRNLFFNYFYSMDFAVKNPEAFNIYDYLYLKKNHKRLPPPVDSRLRKDVEKYLRTAADSIPGSFIDITDKTRVSAIYQKLETLAVFGSHLFREKASMIFKKAFSPDEAFGLFWQAENLEDRSWLLELYMKHVRQVDDPFLVWDRFIYRYIPNIATNEERSKVLKIIMDTNLELIPKKYWNNLMLALRHLDPKTVTLTDWDNWMQRYPLEPQYVKYMFHWIIEKNYIDVFPFLGKRYASFKDFFNGGVLDSLYEFNQSETLRLARELVGIGTGKDRLHAAVFLYNKNCPGYSTFIIRFLERIPDDPQKQRLLEDFYGDLNGAVIRLLESDIHPKAKLKPLLKHPKLFYILYRTNMKFWPEETIRQVIKSPVPVSDLEGYPFLKRCEQLPHEYRKQMLIKIFKADIDTSFRARVEMTLATRYPRLFLELVLDQGYQWYWFTRSNVAAAYKALPVESLVDELIFNLRNKTYGQVAFICEAIVTKNKPTVKMTDINQILTGFNTPLERILLKELRYYLHKRRFLEVKQ